MAGLPFLGEILSVAAALTWAVGLIFFKKTGEAATPLALNLYKNLVALILLGPTLLAAGETTLPRLALVDWVLLAASGFLGIALADTLFLLALARLGAGLVAVVDTLYAPAVLGLSFLFLGERLSPSAIGGALLVVGAIVLGTADRPPPGRTRRHLMAGVAMAAFAMLCMAVGIVMVKHILSVTPVLATATARLFFGVMALLPLLFVARHRRGVVILFRPSALWRTALPGSILGSYLSTICWIGGMKFTLASVAAILNQLSTIFIFLLAAVFLKEGITSRRLVAVAAATAGAVLVSLR